MGKHFKYKIFYAEGLWIILNPAKSTRNMLTRVKINDCLGHEVELTFSSKPQSCESSGLHSSPTNPIRLIVINGETCIRFEVRYSIVSVNHSSLDKLLSLIFPDIFGYKTVGFGDVL